MGIDVSVIIPTRDRARILHQCLIRLNAQTMDASRFEIVVSDDASSDDTGPMVASLGLPNLRYLRQDEHRAAGSARNRAIDAARGDLLALLDDDAFVDRDYLEVHCDAHRREANLVATGPIIDVTEIPALKDRAGAVRQGWHSNPFPSGNASLKRTLMQAAGGFDEDFRAYGWEDPELFERLRRLGVKTRFLRAAPIYHFKPPRGPEDFALSLEREISRGRMGALYLAKWPLWRVALATKQLRSIDTLERSLDRWLALDRRMQEALKSREAPASPAMRKLLLLHAEISAARQERARLRSLSGAAKATPQSSTE